MSVVIASSTCDLSKEVLKTVGVDVVNIPLKINGKTVYYSNEDFDFNEYFKYNSFKVDEIEYKKSFRNLLMQALKSGQDVLVLTANAKYDATYKIVYPLIKELSKKFPNQKMEIVNCYNYSLAYGLIVYEAGIENSRGANIVELIRYINKIKREIKTYLIPSLTTNLKDKMPIVGEMIGVRPFLQIVNGGLRLLKNVKGTKHSVDALKLKMKLASFGDVPFAIMCGDNNKEAEMLVDDVLQIDNTTRIFYTKMNPFCLNYFGDKTLMISFYRKTKI